MREIQMPVITEPPPTVVAPPTPDTTAAPALPSAVYVPGIRYTNDTVARSDGLDFEDYSEVVYQPEGVREAPTTVAPTPLLVAVVATTAAPPPVPATAAPVRGLVEGDEDYGEMYAEVQASTTTTTTSTTSAPMVAPPVAVYVPQPAVTYVQNLPGTK